MSKTKEVILNPSDFDKDFQEALMYLGGAYIAERTILTKILFAVITLLIGVPWVYFLLLATQVQSLVGAGACAAVGFGLSMFLASVIDKGLRKLIFHAFMHTQYFIFVRDRDLMKDVEEHVARYKRQDSRAY